MRFLSLLLAAVPALLLPSGTFAQTSAPYQDSKAALETRVEDLFQRLTPEEKLSLLGGTGFATPAIPRLGVPAMNMIDAGQGARGGIKATEGPATAFPAGVTMASTWDPGLIKRLAQAIGEETRNKGPGSQVLLGPAVNIHRSPLGGRDGEYMSEDPFLAAQLAVGYIQGMQSTGVSACVKHFACNNHEYDRFNMNVQVGERALREIYFPAFEAAVKEGKVWMVMSSYNKVNGTYASANRFLLTDVLKRGWGFDGMVTSDWGGVHETASVQAGNDLEMPNHKFETLDKLQAALADGSVTPAAVDEAARRILRTVIRVGLLDHLPAPDPQMVNSPAHRQLAYEVAAKGIVLLKNKDAFLPFNRQQIHSVAVIGEAARAMQYGARGSPKVEPLHATELIDGIRGKAGGGATVRYATGRLAGEPLAGSVLTPAGGRNGPGFLAEYFRNEALSGPPDLVRVEPEINIFDTEPIVPGFPRDHYSARWSAKLVAPATGRYTFVFSGDDGYRLFIDDHPVIDQWAHPNGTASAELDLEAGKSYDLRAEFFQAGGDVRAQLSWRLPGQGPYAAAIEAARDSDVVVLCVSTQRMEAEGSDRPSMDLPGKQNDLIRAVAAANPRTVVVLNNGTPVTMKDWLERVPGVIEAWLPGQEGGAALAAILFGDVNPSGKLPDTLAAERGDYPDTPNFPGKNAEVNYAEGIYVGYRHFDKDNIEPLFPFGYGLSYTTFAYHNLRVSQSRLSPDGNLFASLDLTNSGSRAGEETVQLFVHDPQPQVDRPIRELKGFAKVALGPGETKTVRLPLRARDLAYFDVAGHEWRANPGNYEIEVGASSRDIRQRASIQLDAPFTEPVYHDGQDAGVPPSGMTPPQLRFPGQSSLEATIGAAHQLAIQNLLTLNTIRDPKQNHNRSGFFRDPPGTFIRAGGDYQTPWTRDSSINSWNAASLLSPEVALNTLWAVVERRNGKLIVQQDNQWWDQVIWITAIWNHYLVTGDKSILAPAYETAVQTLAERRSKNFNAKFGLFAGPSFFNDGISGYPPPLSEPGGGGPSFVLDHPGTDKIMALSTNCVYVAAYRGAANLARELGRPAAEAENLDAQAITLAEAINRHLWIPESSTYGYFLHGAGPDEGNLEKYQEGTGWAFAILFGVADAAKARALVAGVHRDPKGIPSIWPNFPGFSDEHPGRHNNVIWPLVNGLWANAAATTGATEVMAEEIVGVANLALAGNDFREIYNARTGAVDGGWQGGHWDSARHQTWSATSFLRALYNGVFGLQLEREGLRFAPHLPAPWSGISLTDLAYRTGTLDLTLTGAGSRMMRMTLDGNPVAGGFIRAADLAGHHRIEMTLAP